MERNIYKIGKELFITSNEEIKEGDIFIHPDGTIERASRNLDGRGISKIILTDNQDLIKDGVQAINDEFLEWFVKNPSCEEVEIKEEDYSQKCGECGETVKRGYSCIKGCFMKSGNFIPTDKYIRYKIIIPKEEPNPFELQKTLPDDVFYESLEPKQETLEEAAERYSQGWDKGFLYSITSINAFKAGAEWQAERRYSEEEVLVILYEQLESLDYYGDDFSFSLFWEQFKKK